VGGSEFRLPAATELTMVGENRLEARTRSTFAHCRQYLGESTITYGDPEPAGPREAARTNAKLPAGVKVAVKLNRTIELSAAARGDLVEMSVSREVVHEAGRCWEGNEDRGADQGRDLPGRAVRELLRHTENRDVRRRVAERAVLRPVGDARPGNPAHARRKAFALSTGPAFRRSCACRNDEESCT